MPKQNTTPEYPTLFSSVPADFMATKELHELSRAQGVEIQQSKKPGRKILQTVGQELKKKNKKIAAFCSYSLRANVQF